MCHYLLCGNCASVSKLSNGRAVLDNAEIQADKAGKLRALEAELAEFTVKVKYLNRKWRLSKQGYTDVTEAEQQQAQMEVKLNDMRSQLAPFQLWCSYCTWQWPEERPYQIL